MAVSAEELYRRFQILKDKMNELEQELTERVRFEMQTAQGKAIKSKGEGNPAVLPAEITEEDIADIKITTLGSVKEKYYLIRKIKEND